MRSLTLAVVVLLSIAAAASVSAARADGGQLVGTVGTNDAFTIGLVDGGGAPVRNLDPGTYTLLVHDRSALHDFHLSGPGGVDVATDVEGTGDQTFTVTLVAGTYTFRCDPHATTMKGSFTVGGAAPPVTTTTSKPAPKPSTKTKPRKKKKKKKH